MSSASDDGIQVVRALARYGSYGRIARWSGTAIPPHPRAVPGHAARVHADYWKQWQSALIRQIGQVKRDP